VHRQAAALSGDSILLHIGPHKTGTTSIQALLASARDDLLALGVTYPGRLSAHHRAARAVLDRPIGWARDGVTPSEEAWHRLTRTARQASGVTVISSEFFSLCNADQRARVVEDLGRDRLHVLVAARNPGSLALSNWQQVLRSGTADDLDGWLRTHFHREAPGPADQGFWSTAEPATLVENWSQVIGVDRIQVVVIDETDRDLLPTTFEQLLGLPSGFLASRTPVAHNRSLTAPEAELLRQAISRTRDDLSWDEFSLFYRAGYATRLLDARQPPPGEARSVLPPWAAEQAAAEAGSSISRLRASGVSVIGDLENLRPMPAGVGEEQIEHVPVELAAEALAGVIIAAQGHLRRAEEQSRESAAAPAKGRTPDDISTRELAALLRDRVRARVTRRRRTE
jgi:hypothetical protein